MCNHCQNLRLKERNDRPHGTTTNVSTCTKTYCEHLRATKHRLSGKSQNEQNKEPTKPAEKHKEETPKLKSKTKSKVNHSTHVQIQNA